MMKRARKGFSLVEVMVAAFIMVIVMVVVFEAFIYINKNAKILTTYLSSYLKGREAIDFISKDVRMASRVMDAYAGYVTADDCLALKVPSIDASGNIIDVNNEFDYIIYRIDTGDLWKTVIPAASSSRSAFNGVFKKAVESLYMSHAGTGLSSITHKSTVTYLTLWAGIAGDVLGKSYGITTGTTVKLMNYEWEYVR